MWVMRRQAGTWMIVASILQSEECRDAAERVPVGRRVPGVVGRTAEESSPAWPQPLRAPEGAPNVLFIVLDDTGFGQLGCYGSPIATPNIDALAAERPALQQHAHDGAVLAVAVVHHDRTQPPLQRDGGITEMATGYPGYNGQIPFENGFLSEMLQQQGYNTYLVGKWHLMPSEFRRPRPGRTTAGRWGAGSSASTGSSAATPASGPRTWSTTTTRSSRRARPRRATT